MSGFVLEVKPEDRTKPTLEGIRTNLKKTTEDAHEASKAIGGIAAAVGGLDDLASRIARVTDASNGMRASTSAFADQLRREEEILQRIRGPMQQYEQDLRALDGLLDTNSISTAEYANEVSKLNAKIKETAVQIEHTARVAKGNPIVAQRNMTQQAINTIGFGSASPSSIGAPSLLSKLGPAATAGVVGMGVVGGTKMLMDISDQYTNARNTALKFADAGHSVNVILKDQTALSHDLRKDVGDVMGAYDATRDAAATLNMTYQETINLTKTLAQASIMEGQSTSAAAQAMKSLALTFEVGGNAGRQLKGVMDQFPSIADAWTSSLGLTKKEIIEMADSGQLGYEQLARSVANATNIHENFAKRAPTWKETMHELYNSMTAPIDLSAGFRPTQEVIEAIIADIAQIEARMDRLRAKATLTGSYTATRLPTADDAAKAMVSGRIDEVNKAKQDLEALNKTYDEGWISMQRYKAQRTALEDIIRGHSLGNEARDAKKLADEYAKMGQALLGVNAAQRALDRDAADRAAGDDTTKYLSGLDSGTSFTALKRFRAEVSQLSQLFADGKTDADLYARGVEHFRKQFVEKQGLTEAVSGAITPMEKYEALLIKLNEAHTVGAVNAVEYARAKKHIWQETVGDDLAKRMKQQSDDAAKMYKEQEELAAKAGENMANAFSKVLEIIEVATRDGADATRTMVADMLQELAKLLAFQAIKGMFKSGGGSSGDSSSSDFLAALAMGVAGSATGSQTIVGGTGGTDSQLYMQRVTPGERVTIETPAQQIASDRAPAPSGGTKIVNNFDPRMVTAGMDTSEGRNLILNVVLQNLDMIRGRVTGR